MVSATHSAVVRSIDRWGRSRMLKATFHGFVVAMCLLVPGLARAQSVASGAIQGYVTDESGAAMPGVTVTVTSPALQVPSIAVTTEADGAYRVPDLPSGV